MIAKKLQAPNSGSDCNTKYIGFLIGLLFAKSFAEKPILRDESFFFIG